LDQECRFCHQKGHTVKYCKELAKKIAQDEREKKRQQQPRAEPKKQGTRTTQQSRFAILMEDDDEVAAPSAPMKEEFPELGGTWTKRAQATPVEGVSFVDMACKPREVAIAEKQEREKEVQSVQGLVVIKPTPLPQLKEKTEAELAKQKHNYECFRGTNGKSWADMDSDDEDDAPQQVASNDAW
jgi:hypothetical protein